MRSCATVVGQAGTFHEMEQVVTSPSGATFLVRVTRPGDYGEYGGDDPTLAGEAALFAVKTIDRAVHHGKWRVTVWPWPSRASLHHPPVSELCDSEAMAASRADDLVSQIQQGVLRP
jgi:hypothetical protein